MNAAGKTALSFCPSTCERESAYMTSICAFQDSTRSSRSTASTPTLMDSTMFSLKSFNRSYSLAQSQHRHRAVLDGAGDVVIQVEFGDGIAGCGAFPECLAGVVEENVAGIVLRPFDNQESQIQRAAVGNTK